MNVNHVINLSNKPVYHIAIKETFYVQLKLEEQPHLHVVIYVEKYFHVVIINVRKHVMMAHVQIVYYYQRIVKHVLVEKL